MIQNFEEFINEDEITQGLRKSLDKIDVFDSEQDIVNAIIQLGFKPVSLNDREKKTSDYKFLDDKTDKIYTSNKSGNVRCFTPDPSAGIKHLTANGSAWYRYRKDAKGYSPKQITRNHLNSKDRLLLIFRVAIKRILGKEYRAFINSGSDINRFLHDNRGKFATLNFGI